MVSCLCFKRMLLIAGGADVRKGPVSFSFDVLVSPSDVASPRDNDVVLSQLSTNSCLLAT